MVARELVLASASAARLQLLRGAGLDPRVIVSGFDESSLTATDPRSLVESLAVAKAQTVAAQLTDALVLGCDSMLLCDGQLYGKAPSRADVVDRWQRFRGREGVLLTGHCVIDARSQAQVSAVGETGIRFGMPSDAELAAYARTQESLSVAGPFTIDGRAAPFIDSIDGDAGNVIGISLPLVRELLAKVGVQLVDLWS